VFVTNHIQNPPLFIKPIMATATERALAYFVGDYDYSTLCMPQVPWAKEKPKMQFFARNERLPVLMAAIIGLQHAFAMVGGLITPPYVVMKVRHAVLMFMLFLL